CRKVTGVDAAVDEWYAEKILDCRLEIGRADGVRLDAQSAYIAGSLQILLSLGMGELDVGVDGAARLGEEDSSCRGNVGRFDGQVAFEQPFAVLHDPTRGARAAGGEIKIGKPTLAVPDRDVGAENSPNTVEEGASRDIARQGTVLQRAFEIDAGFSQTL